MTPHVEHGMIVDAHLGGYVPGGDVHTYYPDLWRWLVKKQGVETVVDVGCGEGQALDFFAGLGCDVLGIDGVKQPHDRIIQHDYIAGPYTRDDVGFTLGVLGSRANWSADLVWSAEFVEHVEERYVPNFLATFACSDLVLMTHAVPGQNGWHHVNCRTGDYWIGALAAIGYQLDPELTETTRVIAASNERETNYYRDTGLAFRRAT